jgi:hypothetical protein
MILQMKLIQQLDDEDKQTIIRLIDKMLTNKKFKDIFQKNVAALQHKTRSSCGFCYFFRHKF